MTNDKSRLTEELRATLAPGALTREERAEMVETALAAANGADAPTEGCHRRRLVALLLPAAVAAVLLVYFFGPSGKPARPVASPAAPESTSEKPTPAKASVAEARAANESALAAPKTQAALAAAPHGSFAVVAGGKLIGIDTDLPKLLARADKAVPNAPQRFVFRVESGGDVNRGILTARGDRVAGLGLVNVAGMTVSIGPGGTDFSVNGKTLNVKRKGGIEFEIDFGEPGSQKRHSTDFLFSEAFSGVLILPAHSTFPRYEIPGRATVRDVAGFELSYRRYLLRLTIPELSVDLLVPALGDRGPIQPVWTDAKGIRWREIAGRKWHDDQAQAMAESKKTGKPLLLLTGDLSRLKPGLLDSKLVRIFLPQFVLWHGFPKKSKAAHIPTPFPPSVYGSSLEPPALVVLHPAPGGPREFRVGSVLRLGKKCTEDDVLGVLAKRLRAGIPTSGGVTPEIGPLFGPRSMRSLTPREQLRILRAIAGKVSDPSAKATIDARIKQLRKSLAKGKDKSR